MVIKTSQNLTELCDKCVRVNSGYLNYLYNAYVGSGLVDSTIYMLLNKYMNIRYEEEYIIGRAIDSVLMNPHELKMMVDFTRTESLLEKNVKESSVSINHLSSEHDDIHTRFRLIKARECGNIIKMAYAIPVKPQQTKQEMIDQIAIANNAQSRVSAEVEKAKQLMLK